MLNKASEDVLRILLNEYAKNKDFEISGDYALFSEGYQNGLTQIFENLQQYGMIYSHLEFVGGSFQVALSPSALTYFEDKEKALEEEKEKRMAQNISIQNLNANGSNINFGNILNSTLNTQNFVSEIEKRIDEDGAEDKEELKDLLVEVKEICEDMKSHKTVPTRKNLMTKISNHLEKHGWFYGAIVQLLGTATLQAMNL